MKNLSLIFTIFFILISQSAFAAELHGKVVGVHDGDTITVISPNNETTKIRLAQIDAPELSQPYGQKSKQALSEMIFGEAVDVKTENKDRYGRTVGTIYFEGNDINAVMVSRGYAWYYHQYGHSPELEGLQQAAQAKKIGLWSLQADQIEAPWIFRSESKKKKVAAVPLPSNQSFTCGSKTKCSQMRSCTEARFYLSQCGLTKLDENQDGIPCQSLCKSN